MYLNFLSAAAVEYYKSEKGTHCPVNDIIGDHTTCKIASKKLGLQCSTCHMVGHQWNQWKPAGCYWWNKFGNLAYFNEMTSPH